MSSDEDVIKAIVDAFERSDWAEIDVRSGSLRIHLSTQQQTSPAAAVESPADPPQAASIGADADAAATPDAAAVRSIRSADIPAGAHGVVSPSPGIFWRSPQPGAPPFADLGNEVVAGSTLCIVEVMKLMNHISSDVPGTVVGVFIEDGGRVDRGEVLFAIQPAVSA